MIFEFALGVGASFALGVGSSYLYFGHEYWLQVQEVKELRREWAELEKDLKDEIFETQNTKTRMIAREKELATVQAQMEQSTLACSEPSIGTSNVVAPHPSDCPQ